MALRCGWAENGRATMRSVMITLSLSLIGCLHEPTPPKSMVTGYYERFCAICGSRRPGSPAICFRDAHGQTAGTLNEVNLGALAQLEEHLLCKQRVRGSSPLSSTCGSIQVRPSRTVVDHLC